MADIIKHSEDINSDEFIYKEKFYFQRLNRFGVWFVTYQNQIITFGQYRNDLMEWIDINYNDTTQKTKSYTEEDIKSAINFGRDAEAGVIEFDYKNFENLHQQFLNKTDVEKDCLIKKEQYIEVIGLLENISNWDGKKHKKT